MYGYYDMWTYFFQLDFGVVCAQMTASPMTDSHNGKPPAIILSYLGKQKYIGILVMIVVR